MQTDKCVELMRTVKLLNKCTFELKKLKKQFKKKMKVSDLPKTFFYGRNIYYSFIK